MRLKNTSPLGLLDLPLIIFEFHSPHVVVIGEFQTDEIALRKIKMKE